ncbi:MAG: hypothetical protein ACREPE_10605 [Lysobacter sp.]
MLTAAELIEALQRRMQLVDPHRRRQPGVFPPGWQSWFASMHERAGAVTGATSQSLIDILLQRPLAKPPRRELLLNRWQAFATLWRQQWQPPEREDRKVRWFAGAVSALWHLFFGGLLLWLMYVQYLAISPPPLGEDVVQVEFIGVGTPSEVGGGASPAEAAEKDAAAPAESAAATNASEPAAAISQTDVTPSLEAPLPDVTQRDIPEPQLPTPSVQQPVTVSEPVPNETAVFVLPPTTPKVIEASPAAPDLVAPAKPIRTLDVPEPVQPISRELPSREYSARPIESRVSEVAAREVPAPVQRATIAELPSREIAQPQLRAVTAQVRTIDVPAPTSATTAATAPSPAQASSTSTSTIPSPSASLAPAAPTSRPDGSTPASTAGTGPKPVAAPGGWPTPTKSDDWGDSTRNRPGGQRGVPAGVYNSDGSVRLADSPGSASPGLPPGTIEDRITNLDRAGTWLKRKPNDYEPTSFDQYWRPNETLLQEWVRKSITTVRIPIPGTNKHIVCKTVLLALGGGCGITDPNLNEQPARARPPPDIPFKPELQEDNGSIRPSG